jgi:hypothetical protein
VGGEVLHAERVVVVPGERQALVDPASHVGLAHPQLDLLVEEVHHRERVSGSAIHPAQRDRPAAPNRVDGEVQHREPIDPGLLHELLRGRVGQEPEHVLGDLAHCRAVRLHARRVDDGVRAATLGEPA